jgi:hypothetical protein
MRRDAAGCGGICCDLRGWGRTRSRCAWSRSRQPVRDNETRAHCKKYAFLGGGCEQCGGVRRDAAGGLKPGFSCVATYLLLLLLQVLGRGLGLLLLPLLLLRLARLGVGSGVVGHLRRGRIGGGWKRR